MGKEDRKEDRKYVIFISSTIKDLKAERRALIDATLEKGHIPVGMEIFNPQDGDTNVDIINRYVDEADIFVVIVGARYGATLPEGRWDVPGFKPTSYTLYEFNQALKKKIPILKFFMDEKVVENWLKEFPDEEDIKSKEKYNEYKKFIRGNKKGRIPEYSKTFETPGELKNRYILALDTLFAKRPDGLVGWMRANKSPLIGDIVAELNGYATLSGRTQESSILKEAIAKSFLRTYLEKVVMRGYRKFFFESGSSVAYVANAFIKQLEYDYKQMGYVKYHREFEIETNNILAYMNFTLNLRVKNTALFPPGIPEERYGATFGELVDLEKSTKKPEKPDELWEYISKDGLNKISEEINRIKEKFDMDYTNNNGMVFMAASGVDTGVGTGTLGFEGPHVGSYCNMLFKRAILSSKCPTVMFLDEKKLLSKPFEKGSCWPVCDSKLKWMDICKGKVEKPFAIAVAVNDGMKNNTINTMDVLTKNLNFDKKNIIQKKDTWNGMQICTLIAANDKFSELWQ